MSYWRKLFVIVLLIVSLPVQSFAAISMKCETSHSGGEMTSAQHAHEAESIAGHDMRGMAMVDGIRHSHQHGHRAHTCATCASCCFGVALPAVPAVATPAGTAHFAVPLPPSVSVASFLTSGIERPPRGFLV
ncbi:hypothetical protein A8H39_02635 [Paraburkholderia fungorum]|nr:hypothetical protein [Paraburkholderia fungorum]MDE1012111.1 hypothetical protein [Paraburkholderia fungorum]PNE59244.1 hypothetical protein A8H39_02635 [Paraburkholderia fungorum]QLD54057.1 hypothetical protein C9419_33995 [Paraburkholderia fungorum]USU21866.1 hypothetical protein NFE55_40890 [Paraburkholderia fungorum]USU30001.1 hypothetical protein NFS19_39655 [Paraburkholderia fungorum]